MKEFTVKVPIYVRLKPNGKKYYLNLNLLRNQVGHLNNNVKKKFKEEVVDLFPDVFYEQFSVDYALYLPDKRHRDIANVLSIVDKNFCDAFVESGHAPDDNYNHLQYVLYTYGGFDETGEGYALVTVREEDYE